MIQRCHKNKINYNTQYFYREYCKLPSTPPVTQKIYRLVLKTFFSLVIQKIVNEAYRFIFPGVGLFYLIREKQLIKKDKNGKPRIQSSVNWKETNKLIAKTGDKTKKVYYMNDHTDRHIYRIMWDKKQINFTNKNFYTFVLNRNNKQYLYKQIINSDKPLNAYSWYR